MPVTLREVLARHRILIVAGSGGVGKTSVAAALGLAAAGEGRRALVLTIDPARRLATALGLEPLDGEPRELDRGRLEAAGLATRGRLVAAALDRASAWDALVARALPPDGQRRILENPFYRHLSRSFAGSHEYLALDRLCALAERGEHDLIVVDTPPARHALDLLDAPRRIATFVESGALGLFGGAPAAAAARLARRGLDLLARRIEAATGSQTLAEIADLAAALGGLLARARRRAEEARALFADRATAFVLVAAPGEVEIEEAAAFARALLERALPLRAVVVNRFHEPALPPEGAAPEEIAGLLAKAGAAWVNDLAATVVDYEALAAGEARRVVRLLEVLPGDAAVARVPTLGDEVHDLPTLAALGRRLLSDPAARPAPPTRAARGPAPSPGGGGGPP